MIDLLFNHSHHSLNIPYMVTNSLIHGLVYSMIYKGFHNASIITVFSISIVVILALWFFTKRK